jgi:putative intracellular protease/amidase
MKLIEHGEHGAITVTILLFNGAEIIDYAGPWEVFGTAGFQVHTVAETTRPLISVFGQKLIADYTFDNCPGADILLVPGGGVGEAMNNQRLIQFLQSQARRSKHVISVCTGAFLLGKAGLLAGQRATTVDGMTESLREFPNVSVVSGERYVDNGKIITTAGLSSGIDGALHLVSKILGKGEAQSAALNIEYRWDPDSKYSRAALADRFLPDGLAFGLPRVKGAQARMISTAGDTKHWEITIVVSEPAAPAQVIGLLRERISSQSAHMLGAVRLTPLNPGAHEFSWGFTDETQRDWMGHGIVEPATGSNGGSMVTLTVTRNNIQPGRK